MSLELDGGKHVLAMTGEIGESMGFIFKDTEPSPAQDSSGVRQKGDLLGPPPRSHDVPQWPGRPHRPRIVSRLY